MTIEQLQVIAAAAWAYVGTADFAGLVTGVAGTLLLATKGRWAGWGFVAFLASNAAWLYYAHERGMVNLFAQHAVFAVSSLVGVWVWLLRDRVAVRLDRLFADPYDTHSLEDDVWRRFTGRNARQLAEEHGITVGEVFDIVSARGYYSKPKGVPLRVRDERKWRDA